MITYVVNKEMVMTDYPEKANELLEILKNSKSKYKDTPLDEIHWSYSFSYFLKKGESSEEYYQKLVNLPFDERLEVEIKKVRANISLNAGYFYISDRVIGVPESMRNVVKFVTIKKMMAEQEVVQNVDVIKSIPKEEDVDSEPMSLQEQLAHAIEIEDYMEAARIRDLIDGKFN